LRSARSACKRPRLERREGGGAPLARPLRGPATDITGHRRAKTGPAAYNICADHCKQICSMDLSGGRPMNSSAKFAPFACLALPLLSSPLWPPEGPAWPTGRPNVGAPIGGNAILSASPSSTFRVHRPATVRLSWRPGRLLVFRAHVRSGRGRCARPPGSLNPPAPLALRPEARAPGASKREPRSAASAMTPGAPLHFRPPARIGGGAGRFRRRRRRRRRRRSQRGEARTSWRPARLPVGGAAASSSGPSEGPAGEERRKCNNWA